MIVQTLLGILIALVALAWLAKAGFEVLELARELDERR